VDIIGQDVARLDRLVGEISNASRLDAELVREQAVEFDLVPTIRDLVAHLSHAATAKGIEMISDLPAEPVPVVGLEARLAQVVVNIVGNAISLCEEGDAIRVWLRRRDRRVLIVVEDTGPGIPDGEAEKIFRRFYSQRPAEQFGGNSGLGLSISRQIVEAHDGVIWAENIRPTESDLLSEPLGARFVVVLPL
jgi:two-component system sensor histidine kinase ChvG